MRSPGNLSALNHTTGGAAFVDFEDLLHGGSSNDGLANHRIKHSLHRIANLVDQFVNDGKQFDLNTLPLG